MRILRILSILTAGHACCRHDFIYARLEEIETLTAYVGQFLVRNRMNLAALGTAYDIAASRSAARLYIPRLCICLSTPICAARLHAAARLSIPVRSRTRMQTWISNCIGAHIRILDSCPKGVVYDTSAAFFFPYRLNLFLLDRSAA